MIGYVEAPAAWVFTRSMARVLGVDLTGAVVDGWLSRAELGALVATCADCRQTGACSSWLAGRRPGETAPEFCANGAALGVLRG